MDNWKNILNEDILRTNAIFAVVFVMNYECLKEFAIDQIKFFYAENYFMDGDNLLPEESNAYKEKVRALDKNLENASLKWFIDVGAIQQEDYNTYQKIRKRRNDITHKLLKNLNDGFGEKDALLFADMLTLYNKLDNWWMNEIEIPISEDSIPKDYDKDLVCGGQAFVISIINDILLGNEKDRYKKLLSELIKQGLESFQDK